MPTIVRTVVLAALCSQVLSSSAVAQSAPRGLPRLSGQELLLPSEPTLGWLGLDQAGNCDVRHAMPVDAYADLSPIHQQMVRNLLRRPFGTPAAHGCWLHPPTPAAAALFNAAIMGPQGFQAVGRWSSTATSGGGLGQGDPTILTFSFVPDGTFIPDGVGEGPGLSDMFSVFNSVFPSQSTWQDRIADAFTRWGELTGTTYVLEPNDDGASMIGSGGIVGVRGDIRIGGKFIDGASGGVLAYNYYPAQGGEMVFDTGDTAYFTSTFGNYRQLFNTAGHELGHGLGLDHVCPGNGTKLMEPLIINGVDGPQFDDVLAGHRLYGDPNEHNDTVATATDLGVLPDGLTNVSNVSIDGVGDADVYRVDVLGDKLLSVDVVPVGSPYLEGPQVGNCNTGTLFDPGVLRNLDVFLYDATGTSLIAFSNSQPIGATESLNNIPLTTGTYHLRVNAGPVDQVQMYRLAIDVVDNGNVAAATPVGTGCGGLTWTDLNRPVLGGVQILRLDNIPNPTSSVALILLGVTEIPGGFDLGLLGAPTCTLYVDPLAIPTVLNLTQPSYIWFFPIPNVLSLSGSTIWTQGAALVPPGTNALNAISANAVELTLGTQ